METRCRAVSFIRLCPCLLLLQPDTELNNGQEDSNSLIPHRHKSADMVGLPVVAALRYAPHVLVQLMITFIHINMVAAKTINITEILINIQVTNFYKNRLSIIAVTSL